MTRSDSTLRTELGNPARPAGALLVSMAPVVVWAVAAALRPHATYHLAPAIVMAAYPVLRWRSLASGGRRAVAVTIGAAIASTTAVALQWAGWLDGPALVGGTGFDESMIVIAAASLVGLAVAFAGGSVRSLIDPTSSRHARAAPSARHRAGR